MTYGDSEMETATWWWRECDGDNGKRRWWWDGKYFLGVNIFQGWIFSEVNIFQMWGFSQFTWSCYPGILLSKVENIHLLLRRDVYVVPARNLMQLYYSSLASGHSFGSLTTLAVSTLHLEISEYFASNWKKEYSRTTAAFRPWLPGQLCFPDYSHRCHSTLDYLLSHRESRIILRAIFCGE